METMINTIKSESLKALPCKEYLSRNSKSIVTLDRFSNHFDFEVRGCVACNTNCPINILKRLSKDSYNYVRVCVALNTSCTVEILEKLSNDPYPEVRYEVAKNPNCTVQILEKLLNDSHWRVRYYANQIFNQIRSVKI